MSVVIRLLVLLALLPSTALAGATLEVGAGRTYATLPDAVAVAVDGDVIHLASGTHGLDEDLQLTADVTISGTTGTVLVVETEGYALTVASGASVRVEALAITMDGGTIFSVGADAALSLVDVDLSGAARTTSYRTGAMITGAGASLVIEGSRFHDLDALGHTGAAFRVSGGATATVHDTTFERCVNTTNGGAITVSDGTLVLDHATFLDGSAERGGALYVNGSTAVLAVRDSRFEGDSSEQGGAIRVIDASSVTIQRSTFDDCVAVATTSYVGRGGAIWLDAFAGVAADRVIEDCTFSGGSAKYGGAIAITAETGAILRRNRFCSNRATTSGGAIYLESDAASVVVENAIFDDNTAPVGGGLAAAAGATDPTLTVVNSDFLGNAATSSGSAIWAGTGAVVVSRNNLFDANGTASTISGSGIDDDYSAWSANTSLVGGGAARGVHRVDAPPQLGLWSDDGDCTNDDLRLLPGSPLIDAGDPTVFDLDHTRSDIGVWGGAVQPQAWTDADSDGSPDLVDCDDADAAIHPGLEEHCDGRDEDCDGRIDLPIPPTAPLWFQDVDADGYGVGGGTRLCAGPTGYVGVGGDCDDASPEIRPDALERCNAIDDDCDALIDQADDPSDFPVWFTDGDADGYGAPGAGRSSCTPIEGRVDNDLDCDDGDAARSPDSVEFCNDRDDDCDGDVDDDPFEPPTFYRDNDGDHSGSSESGTLAACVAPDGWVAGDDDCDDDDPQRYRLSPVETCAGPEVDYNCDGQVGHGDLDGDGYPACGDCNDADGRVHPGAPDVAHDGIKQDCDRVSDDDYDRDGHDAASFGGDDCADDDPARFPGAAEIAGDGIDQDCDGEDATVDTGEPATDDVHTVCGGCSSDGAGVGGWAAALAALAVARRRRR